MSELIARQEISLDLVKYKYVTVNAKFEDVNSRWLLIKVLNVGTFFPLDDSYQVKLKIITPDNRYLALTSYGTSPRITFEDGCALVQLTSGVLLESGTANAELTVSLGEIVISTMPFTIEIIKGTYSDGEIVEDPDAESAITQLLSQIQDYVDSVSDYASSASSSATAAANSATQAAQYVVDVQTAIDDYTSLVTTSISDWNNLVSTDTASWSSTVSTDTSNWSSQVSTDLSTLQSYVTSASNSASAASTYASNASNSETNASTYASNASNSETAAANSATDASDSATLSESWAIGGTNTRTGENTNNSKYYAELAENYKDQAAAIAGGDFVTHAEVGANNGVASLTSSGIVDSSQLLISDSDDETIIKDASGIISVNEFVGTKAQALAALSSLSDGVIIYTTDE